MAVRWWHFLVIFLFPIFSVYGQQNQNQIRPGYILSGDLVLPESMPRFGYQTNQWPGGVVPYAFDPAVTEVNRERAVLAMYEWETASGVRFVPRTSQGNYIKFFNGDGNWSYVGMVGGEQLLSMKDWEYKFVIVHELGHALGVWHEQQRPDRDQYVHIHFENIIAGTENNFTIVSDAVMSTPYDFLSVMHYGTYYLSKNGLMTIEVLPAYSEYQDQIGNRDSLSTGDRAGMQALYPGTPKAIGDTRSFPVTMPTINWEAFTTTVNTKTATVDASDPVPSCLGANTLDHTVWFLLDPPYFNTYSVFEQFSASVSGYDTLFVLYEENMGSLKEAACVSSSAETMSTAVVRGHRYFIMAAGLNGADGKLDFTAQLDSVLLPSRSGADDFDQAVEISEIEFFGITDTTIMTHADDDPTSACTTMGSSTIWYKFTAPLDGPVRLEPSSNLYTLTSVWTGTRGSLTEVMCSDMPFEFEATAGTTYFIMVEALYNGGLLTFRTDLASENLLVNGDLEDTDADKNPDEWTVVNGSKDKSKCGTFTGDVSKSGLCAFGFTGQPGSKTKLTQTVVYSGLSGDAFRFSLWMKNRTVASKFKMKIKLQFVSGDIVTSKTLAFRPTDLMYYRRYMAPMIVAPTDYDQINVIVQFSAPQGNLLIDELSLSRTAEFTTGGLLPLPPAP